MVTDQVLPVESGPARAQKVAAPGHLVGLLVRIWHP